MDDLDILLQERSNLRNRINGAMKELKTWFNDKIDDVKDYFGTLKEKVTESKSDIVNSRVITKDLVISGKVIFRKGTTVSTVLTKIGKLMNGLKNEVHKTLLECKNGIKHIVSKQYDNAIKCKEIVLDNIKKITIVGSIIVGSLGAITFSHKVDIDAKTTKLSNSELRKISDKRRKDTADFELKLIAKRRDDNTRELESLLAKRRKDIEINNDKVRNKSSYSELVDRDRKLNDYIKKTNKYLYGPRDIDKSNTSGNDYKERMFEKRRIEEEDRARRRQQSIKDNEEYMRNLNAKRDRMEEERRKRRAEVAKQVEAYKKKYGVL